MLTLVHLLLVPAHADLWSANLGDVLSKSSDVAWVTVDAEHHVRVTRTVRGDRAPDSVHSVRPDLPVGAVGVLACGHPPQNACMLAVQKPDGIVWVEDVGLGKDHGSAIPGVTTMDRLEALIADRPTDPLCVKIGDETVHVDAATGRGETPEGPVGVVAGGVMAVIQRYGKDETVYVGRRGARGGGIGGNGRLGIGGCLEFDLVRQER